MKRAGEYLTAIIDADLLMKAKTYSGFFSSWAVITRGCGIAAASGYSRIRELERGILVVEADHPGWIQLLQTKAPGILSAARGRFPELDIRGISFTLSKPPVGGTGRSSGSGEDGPEEGAEMGGKAAFPGPAPKTETVSGSTPAALPGPEPGPVPGNAEAGGDAGVRNRDGVWERIAEGDFKDSLKRLEASIKNRERSGPGTRGEKKRRTP